MYLEEGGTLKSVALAISAKYNIRKTVSGVQQILVRKEYYTGEYTVYMRDPDNTDKPLEPFTITFEPLIDKEAFEAASLKRQKNKNYRTPYPKQKIHPLSKLIKCPFCGHSFSPRVRSGEKPGVKYRIINGKIAYSWICMTRINNAGQCLSRINLNDEKTETIVWEFIKKELLSYVDLQKDTRDEKIYQLKQKLSEAKAQIPLYQQEITKTDTILKRAYQAYLSSPESTEDIALQLYNETISKVKKRRDDYSQEIAILNERIKSLEVSIEYYSQSNITADYIASIEDNDEEKRKRLVIYINPPYAEAASYGGGENKRGVAAEHKISHLFKDKVGRAINELFVQFFLRTYTQISGCILASFSTLKYINAQNFIKFRDVFSPEYKGGFICPAFTFDNVNGQFPIGFLIWDLSIKEPINDVVVDVYDAKEQKLQLKTISPVRKNGFIVDWLRLYFDKENERLAYLRFQGTDFQTKNHAFFTTSPSENDFRESKVTNITHNNVIPMCVYLGVRQCIEATWLNDRDQFLFPNDGWKFDRDFQSDCLAYTLFHGQNRITSAEGINHWIPFTEQQVNAPDNFQSHFMSDFINGKLKPQNTDTLFGEEESLIPTEPIKFTPAAQAVMEAGRKLWEYYLHKKDKELYAEPVNVNASFYDIRAYFQGFENGKMRNKSDDEKYNELLRDLRTYQKVLAKQIEKKVYLYGFLKGEAQVDPSERLTELQRENAELRQKLKAQQSGSLVNYGTVNIYEK